MIHLVPAFSLWLAAQIAPVPAAERSSLFEFPAGRIAERVAELGPEVMPVETPADLGRKDRVPAIEPGAWSRAETWEAWSRLVELEGSSPRADPERRARLALLALAQGRSEDAWKHLAALDDPRWLAAVLPRFLPGVSVDTRIGVGGASAPLPDGVVLSPALPPRTRHGAEESRVDRRAMSVRSLVVGAAVVSLRVSVEAEGVQIDVRHVAGESARLSILIPAHPDHDFADEYVDWYRQDARRVPHALVVRPGEAEHTIYGRFEPRAQKLHGGVPRELPGSIREGGLWFEIRDEDPARGFLAAIAAALEKRSFGFTLGVRAPRRPGATWSGVAFPLDDPATRDSELAWLASALERFVLERAPR